MKLNLSLQNVFHFVKLKLDTWKNFWFPPLARAWQLPCYFLSMNLATLGTSHKQNHTVLVRFVTGLCHSAQCPTGSSIQMPFLRGHTMVSCGDGGPASPSSFPVSALRSPFGTLALVPVISWHRHLFCLNHSHLALGGSAPSPGI